MQALFAHSLSRRQCASATLQVCGNLLSDAFGVNGVGASTACYGLIGVQLSRLFIVEWRYIANEDVKDSLKRYWLQTAGFLAFWEFINWQTIDHFGHLGGLLGGLCCGLLLNKPQVDAETVLGVDAGGS